MPKGKQNKKVRKVARKVEKRVMKDMSRPKRQNKPKGSRAGKILREIGGTVGGLFGMRGVGTELGAGISRVFGQGDYKIASTSVAQGGPPAFGSLKSGTRIRHREYIRDISSSTAFSSTTFQINPGMDDLFPWLSTVAVNFEEYKIHGLIVYLNSNSATAVASTNTALGVWGAVTQYDPSEPDFTTKQQAENYQGCASAVPSSCILHAVECANKANVLDRRYVRSGGIPSTEDLKFYDLGKLQVFSQGAQASSVIGEMWVTYDIEFFKPRLPTGGSNATATDFYNVLPGTSNPFASAVPIGDGFTSMTTSSIQVQASAPTGYYQVFVYWGYSVAATVAYNNPVVSGSGEAVLLWGNAATLSGLRAPQSAVTTSTNHAFTAVLKKTSLDSAMIINFSSGYSTTQTPTFCNVLVSRLSVNPFELVNAPKKPVLDTDEVSDLRKLLLRLRLENEDLFVDRVVGHVQGNVPERSIDVDPDDFRDYIMVKRKGF